MNPRPSEFSVPQVPISKVNRNIFQEATLELTMRQPLKEMAEAVYRMAVTEGPQILANPKKIAFKPELIVREST